MVIRYEIVAQGGLGSVILTDAGTGTFVYTPQPNANGADTFTFRVSDGKEVSNIATVAVSIAAVNDVPVVENQDVTIPEDRFFWGAMDAVDVDGDVLTFVLVTDPGHGSAMLTDPASGTFLYTPAANFNGVDSFTISVSDGQGGTATATVTLTVLAVNDAPVAGDVSISTSEDSAVSGGVSATDLDGDSLTYAVGAAPAHGAVTVDAATGVFTYTPAANFNGADSFTISVSDGQGGTATATVTVTVLAVNDAPVAVNDEAATDAGIAVTVAVLANDSDVEGDALRVQSVSQGANGQTAIGTDSMIAGDVIRYLPNVGFVGQDIFTYQVSDGKGGLATGTVNVTVRRPNTPPTASDGAVSTTVNRSVSGRAVATDVDQDVLSFALKAQSKMGRVTLNAATGAFTYTPKLNVRGVDTFKFIANDGKAISNIATVTVTIQ